MAVVKFEWVNEDNQQVIKTTELQKDIFYFADSTLTVTEAAPESSGTTAAHQDASMVSPSNTVWDLNAY